MNTNTKWHAVDWRTVYWNGRRYSLTPKQGAVAARLWEAWEDGTHEVPQADLLRAADSDCVRLLDLFRRADAWGKLVLMTGPGVYRLAPPLAAGCL